MNSNDLHLNNLITYAKNNISDITYDRCDERKEIIKSILYAYRLEFSETLPGNDLYSYKFTIRTEECEKCLYVNYGYNLAAQSEYFIRGSCRHYNKISSASEYAYINEIIKLGFVYVKEDILFSEIFLDDIEKSGGLSPFFCSAYFEDI